MFPGVLVIRIQGGHDIVWYSLPGRRLTRERTRSEEHIKTHTLGDGRNEEMIPPDTLEK